MSMSEVRKRGDSDAALGLYIHILATPLPNPSLKLLKTSMRLTLLLEAAGSARLLATCPGSQAPQEGQAPGRTW